MIYGKSFFAFLLSQLRFEASSVVCKLKHHTFISHILLYVHCRCVSLDAHLALALGVLQKALFYCCNHNQLSLKHSRVHQRTF